MPYKIRLENRAKKELKLIPQKDRVKITRVFEDISYNPFVGKKLSGKFFGYYAVRAWPYRIIYEIYKSELYVSVIHIGHRQGIYKK